MASASQRIELIRIVYRAGTPAVEVVDQVRIFETYVDEPQVERPPGKPGRPPKAA